MDRYFTMQICGDYAKFAGVRELRAWRITASNGAAAYSMEFENSRKLFHWLLDTLETSPEEARSFVDDAEQGQLVPVNYFMKEESVKSLGFKEGGKTFTPPEPFSPGTVWYFRP